MGSLDGKVALITGGSRGIGKEIVRRYAEQGATVVFTYRRSGKEAQELIADLDGHSVFALQSDASSYGDAEQLVKQVLSQHEKVDVLINNAGITVDNLMLRMGEEQWDKVVNTNLKSVFNLTKHILKPMLRQRSGSIINMGSVVGIFGNAGQANYAASKAGIIGFSKSIAKEVGSRSIRCNVVTPGFIETDMTDQLDEKTKASYIDSIPLKRLGSSQDVSELCVFLGSDKSTYITGQVISVCGGLSM